MIKTIFVLLFSLFALPLSAQGLPRGFQFITLNEMTNKAILDQNKEMWQEELAASTGVQTVFYFYETEISGGKIRLVQIQNPLFCGMQNCAYKVFFIGDQVNKVLIDNALAWPTPKTFAINANNDLLVQNTLLYTFNNEETEYVEQE